MAVKSRTRKILWGRSGNRCAICRRELVMQETTGDSEAIVGDECHIVSKQDDGPRSYKTNLINDDLDGYDNLILLCKIHHKLVDDQPDHFSKEKLKHIKFKHEHWVRESLGGNQREPNVGTKFQGITLLPRIHSGKDLVNIVKGAHFFRFDNDEPETFEEMEMVRSFLQELQDYGDILQDLDVGESVRAGFQLTQELEGLRQAGFLIFGERKIERLKVGGIVDNWIVAIVCILRETNPAIVNLSDLEQGREPGSQSELPT